jgi:uncharacterized protein
MARRRRPSHSRRPRLGGAVLFALGLLVGAGALYLFLSDPRPPEAETDPGRPAPVGQSAPPDSPEPRAEPAEAAAPPDVQYGPDDVPAESPDAAGSETVSGIRVALVIDDLGRSLEELERIRSLGVPVSYAVLPFEELTREVVAELRRGGEEILCHLPMEPRNGENPGPGALRHAMTDGELAGATRAALQAVPGAAGVNNHMGSRLSSDERSMRAVLGVLAERGLFFLDSRTAAESVGYRVAARLGIPAAERQVFLDRDPDPEAIRAQFERLLALARERGAAVAIGHPHPETLEVLAQEVPRARELGYEFVPVSYLLDRASVPE